MQTIEYLVRALHASSASQLAGGNIWGPETGIEGAINTAAKDGWELVQLDNSVIPGTHGFGGVEPEFNCIITFRRPVQETSAK
jgi:hypothetical protein